MGVVAEEMLISIGQRWERCTTSIITICSFIVVVSAQRRGQSWVDGLLEKSRVAVLESLCRGPRIVSSI
jgi:hypothetical protein